MRENMADIRRKSWHVWLTMTHDHTKQQHVISCGPQQARKLVAALWSVKYADVDAQCCSRQLPPGEGHGPRLAPEKVIYRYGLVNWGT
jgi:hypothetical protein